MNRTRHIIRYVGLLLAIAALWTGISIALMQEEAPHWTYEGEEGPEHWGELSEEFAACGDGLAQSPIDLSNAQEVDLSDIGFSYGASALTIFNNGHTIEVRYDAGSSIQYNGITYDLLQFHFHHPSEHTINGETFPMEIHFVHRSATGNYAVVGVMLLAGDSDNDAYAPIFENLPTEALEHDATPEPMNTTIDANSLLPATRQFATYNGSLTTPPCSEIVRWLVMGEPIYLSEAQIEAFGAIFENNARPTLPLGDRDLLLDTTFGT